MNPRIFYLLELSTLIGRLSHALETNDIRAYVNILGQIRDLTNASIKLNSPRLPFRVVDDTPFDEGNDDEL